MTIVGRILFIAWCSLVVILFAMAVSNGWSPFADSGRGGSGGIFVRSGGGPRHK
ncbi:hypothetical protein [Sandarakinorhabdus sp. DWP1-3-1]|uniref:hypothetical protein n=1 Tax=Sandarakinorhabdus sp. DWP1-3-1 TaxID=2804627 RepID=UPI003CE794EA